MTTDITSSHLAEERALREALVAVEATSAAGGRLRVLGGVAVALRCPSARGTGPFARTYSDIDFVADRDSSKTVVGALEELSYVPERRFNAVHGHRRLMFAREDGVHVDVFVDRFEMCHNLDLAPRLGLHGTTLPLADLLLTKLQVAALNAKDVTDAAALLADHALTTDTDGIDPDYIVQLLRSDWGWWRTVTHNLGKLPEHLDPALATPTRTAVVERAAELLAAVEIAPKTFKWKARAKAGDRLPWREEPEESH